MSRSSGFSMAAMSGPDRERGRLGEHGIEQREHEPILGPEMEDDKTGADVAFPRDIANRDGAESAANGEVVRGGEICSRRRASAIFVPGIGDLGLATGGATSLSTRSMYERGTLNASSIRGFLFSA